MAKVESVEIRWKDNYRGHGLCSWLFEGCRDWDQWKTAVGGGTIDRRQPTDLTPQNPNIWHELHQVDEWSGGRLEFIPDCCIHPASDSSCRCFTIVFIPIYHVKSLLYPPQAVDKLVSGRQKLDDSPSSYKCCQDLRQSNWMTFTNPTSLLMYIASIYTPVEYTLAENQQGSSTHESIWPILLIL